MSAIARDGRCNCKVRAIDVNSTARRTHTATRGRRAAARGTARALAPNKPCTWANRDGACIAPVRRHSFQHRIDQRTQSEAMTVKTNLFQAFPATSTEPADAMAVARAAVSAAYGTFTRHVDELAPATLPDHEAAQLREAADACL